MSSHILARLCLLAALLLLAVSLSSASASPDGPGASAAGTGTGTGSTAGKAAKKPNRQLPVISVEKLAQYDGRNESLPLLVALDRRVYDVSSKRDVYGPGGGYETFSGRDSTRNFALYSTESKDDGSCIDDLEEKDFKMLAEWRRWFDERYPLVAVITEKLCEADDTPEDAARRGFSIPASSTKQSAAGYDGQQQKPFKAPASEAKSRPPSPSTEL